MHFPWETEAHAKIVSLENFLCNCNCNLSRKIHKIVLYVCNVFVDDGKLSIKLGVASGASEVRRLGVK